MVLVPSGWGHCDWPLTPPNPDDQRPTQQPNHQRMNSIEKEKKQTTHTHQQKVRHTQGNDTHTHTQA